MSSEGFYQLLEFLFRHGSDWKVWVGVLLGAFVWGLWRAKRFRFLIEYKSKE